MDAITIILFVVNNLLWMFFFYIFTPQQQTRGIKFPNPLEKVFKKGKKNPNAIQEITDLDMTPEQVIQQMKGKTTTDGQ